MVLVFLCFHFHFEFMMVDLFAQSFSSHFDVMCVLAHHVFCSICLTLTHISKICIDFFFKLKSSLYKSVFCRFCEHFMFLLQFQFQCTEKKESLLLAENVSKRTKSVCFNLIKMDQIIVFSFIMISLCRSSNMCVSDTYKSELSGKFIEQQIHFIHIHSFRVGQEFKILFV